jgi:hypothetical protein
LERYKSEFARININFESQLGIATRRIQVELDALSLIHKLRTEQEFTRINDLWKHMVELRSSLLSIIPTGLGLAYTADEQQRDEWEQKTREKFNVCVGDVLRGRMGNANGAREEETQGEQTTDKRDSPPLPA